MKKSIASGNLSHQFDASTDLRISGAWRWCADSAAVGRRLCSLRKECSLTQQMLSDIICANCAETASVNTISSWERGKKLPSLVHLMFLQGLYGVSLFRTNYLPLLDRIRADPEGDPALLLA